MRQKAQKSSDNGQIYDYLKYPIKYAVCLNFVFVK